LAPARDRPPLYALEQARSLMIGSCAHVLCHSPKWISPRYIRERSIDATPAIERSIPFSASNAWISTSEAPRSRRLNACTTTQTLRRSTTSTPSPPRT
jgi:hypothetical protein